MRVTLAAIIEAAFAAIVAWGIASTGNAQTDATAPEGSIVFLAAPELPPTVRAGLIDALEAQLTGTGTTLHWETMTSVGTDLRAAIDQGKPAATAHSAAGVFWLDASGASDWLLYLMDASGERILVRRMEGAAAAPGASIEAIAVIVRESAVALSTGRPIAMSPLETPAPPAPPIQPPEVGARRTVPLPAPAPRPASVMPLPLETPGMVRGALGYVVSPLSDNVPWQHGLDLHLSIFTPSGLFTGVAYSLLSTLTVRGEGFTLGLDRRPIRLLFGISFGLGRAFRLDAEAAAILDVVTRTTLSAPASAIRSDDDTRAIFGAGLTTRLNWTPQPSLELFFHVGIEAFLNRFDYAIERNLQRVTLLSPLPATPVAGLGIAFRP